MKFIRFTVDGDPFGKQRPRFSGAGAGAVRTYTPQKTRNYEHFVQDSYYYQIGRKGLGYFEPHEPVYMLVDAVFRIPESMSKSDRQKAIAGEILPVKRADADNIAKVCMDSLNGCAYHDDAQVVEICCRKMYGENPHVTIRMSNEPLVEPVNKEGT